MYDLSGKVALVTGGSSGIGRAIALGLAQAGARIGVAARGNAKCAAVVTEIINTRGNAIAVQCDVVDRSSVAAAIDRTADAFGGIDILVNSAGVNALAPEPQMLPPEDWNRVIATNLTGIFNVCTLCHPQFKARGGGKIINISSMMAIFGGATATAYSASKGGVDQYTRSLAVAWAEQNIQVNALQPGWIVSNMSSRSRSSPQAYNGIVDRTPAGRFGNPEDVVGPAVFFASSASDFVTGVLLPVDGGYSAQATSRSIGI